MVAASEYLSVQVTHLPDCLGEMLTHEARDA